MKQKIIDVHMHANFNNTYSIKIAKDLGIDFNLNGLLRDFKKHNIVRAVTLPFPRQAPKKAKTPLDVRNEARRLVLQSKGKLICACTISPIGNARREMETIEGNVKEGIYRAIKLYPGYEYFYPDQKECTPIYSMAEKYDIPVLFHSGDTIGNVARIKYAHPLSIDDVAVSFPKVKFVICHLGSPWISDAVELVYKNKNVYADLSGLSIGKWKKGDEKYDENRLNAIMEGICYDESVIEKLMFGTDYPLVSYDHYIRFIKKLNLSKKEFNKIFFENAAKVFKVKSPI